MGMVERFSQEQKAEIVDHVCDEIIAKRMSLFRVLEEARRKDQSFPSYSVMKRWQRESETFSTQIAQAREDALEALIEEMIEISKDEKLDHNSRRVRIIAIEKAAQMLVPRRFGQKVDVTSGGEKLPAPQAARADRVEGLLVLAAQRALAHGSQPIIDVTPEPDIDDVMG